MLSQNGPIQNYRSVKEKKLVLLVEENSEDEALTLRALESCKVPHRAIVTHDTIEALTYLFGTKDPSVAETGSKSSTTWETKLGGATPKLNPLPQLILLDVQPPKMSALQVLQEIRSCDRTKLVPAIVLSPSTDKEDLLHSYDLGCNSYISKSVSFIEFARALEQMMIYWLQFNKSLS